MVGGGWPEESEGGAGLGGDGGALRDQDGPSPGRGLCGSLWLSNPGEEEVLGDGWRLKDQDGPSPGGAEVREDGGVRAASDCRGPGGDG